MDFLINIVSSMPLWLLAWLPTIIFTLAVILGILRGMRRGYRKSMVLLIKSIIAISLTFLLYLILFVWHPESFDERFISVFNSIFGYGRFQLIIGVSTDYTSISQIALSIATDMASNMGDHFLAFWPEEIIAAYIAALAEIFLRLIVFAIFLVIYFILNRIVLWIIYLIFFREGKRKKKINRLYSEGLVDQPYKKKRLGGAIIGGLAATVKSFVYLSFFAMFAHIITGSNFNSNGIQNQSDREVSDEMMAITNLYNFFHASGSTGIMNLFTNSNTMPFFMFFADYVASGRIDIEDEDTQYVLLREELAAITNITHILWTHIVENGLFDIGGEDSQLDFSEILSILLQDDNFEEVITDAFDRFANTTVISGLARHTLDSMFKGFAYSSENPLVELFFGGDSPLIYTDAIFSGDNFSVVVNVALRTFRLLDDIANNFSDLSDIELSELLEGLSNNADEVTDLINELLRLSFFNNIDISERLNEAIATALGDVLEGAIDNFDPEILNYIQFVHPTEGVMGGELGRIINLTGDLLTSGILNYILEPMENIESIIYVLTSSNGGQSNLIARLFEESELAHVMLSSLLMNFELGNDISIIVPNTVLTNFNDSNFLILSQTEIVTVINALSQLLLHVDLEDLQQDPMRVLLDLLKYEMDLVLDLFDSLLLQATFANVIITMAGDFLEIHENLMFIDQEGNINQDRLNIWLDTYSTTGELNSLINAMVSLDLIDLLIEVLDNEDAELDIINTILDLLEQIGDEELHSLYDSIIIRNLFSRLILEVFGEMLDVDLLEVHQGNSMVITVCDVTFEYIFTFEELRNMVIALSVLSEMLSDGIENLDPLDLLDLDVQAIDTMLSSYVIWHFMAEMLTQVLEDILIIPNKALENDTITRDEILNLINSLRIISSLVDGVDLQNLESIMENPLFILDLIDANEMEESSLYMMLDSYIVWQLISSTLTNILTIPSTVIYNDGSNDFITKLEIFNLVNALAIIDSVIDGIDFDNIESIMENPLFILDLIDANEMEETSLYVMLNSYIMWLTISTALLDLLPINIPGDVIHTVQGNDFIQKNEMFSLVNALSILVDALEEETLQLDDLINIFQDISILRNVSGNMGDEPSSSKIYQILNSLLIHTLVTDVITDIIESSGDVLSMPSQLQSGLIPKEELVYFFRAIVVLLNTLDDTIEISDIISLSYTSINEESNNVNDMKLYHFFKSVIMHESISGILINVLTSGNTPILASIPQTAIDENGLISRFELVTLMQSFNDLGIADPGHIVIDDLMDMLFASTGEQGIPAEETILYDLLNSSKIMYAIISNLLEEIVISLIGEDELESILVNELIPRIEIVYLLRAISSLVGESGSITGEISLNFEDYAMFEELLNSRIIHIKISQIILNDVLGGRLPQTAIIDGVVRSEDLLEFIETLFIINSGHPINFNNIDGLIDDVVSLDILDDILVDGLNQYILRTLITTQLLEIDLPLLIRIDDVRATYEVHLDLSNSEIMLIKTSELLNLKRILSQIEMDLTSLIDISATELLSNISSSDLEDEIDWLSSKIFWYSISSKISNDTSIAFAIMIILGGREAETVDVNVWKDNGWLKSEIISEEDMLLIVSRLSDILNS